MKEQSLNTLNHCVYSITYHLVLVTKYRKKCISKPILKRLKDIFEVLCSQWECTLLEFNGEVDHVHLLLSLNPKVQPSKLVNNFKTVSSRKIRKEFQETLNKVYYKPVFWSRTYCMITCGGAPLSIIKQYIENQKEIE